MDGQVGALAQAGTSWPVARHAVPRVVTTAAPEPTCPGRSGAAGTASAGDPERQMAEGIGASSTPQCLQASRACLRTWQSCCCGAAARQVTGGVGRPGAWTGPATAGGHAPDHGVLVVKCEGAEEEAVRPNEQRSASASWKTKRLLGPFVCCHWGTRSTHVLVKRPNCSGSGPAQLTVVPFL